ncbi:MAG: DUF3459 domain-containing protein, partial [Acidobacteriaceae bacterium]|nr:DUF3459 domain-containing protein [Acidobacteriaceae bacterium]
QLTDAEKLRVALAVLLLAPSPPLLFMGEEFGADTPFLFFCDFGPDLAAKVTDGRRSEFARFAQFSSAEAQARIPDPGSRETFMRSKLDWASLQMSSHIQWLQFYRGLLSFRQKEIVPLVSKISRGTAKFEVIAGEAVSVKWQLTSGQSLEMIANFSSSAVGLPIPQGKLLYTTAEDHASIANGTQLAAVCGAWFLST